MTDDSLFVALRRYRPSEGRDPVEDFVTEAFAWLLRQVPGLAEAYRALVVEALGLVGQFGPAEARWLTQVRTPQGVLDLVSTSSALTLVFEHKVWSAVGSTQVARYRKAAEERWGQHVAVVVVAGGRRQFDAAADLNLRWAEVHAFLARWSAAQPAPPPLVADFLALLEHEGLGPDAPIAEEALRSYYPARPLKDRLMQATRLLAKRDWSFVYDRLTDAGSSLTAPYLRWGKKVNAPRDGRVGLDFFRHWRPGLFVGVILDWEPYGVPPSDLSLGPDLSIVLDYSVKPSAQPTVHQYVRADAYTALRSRLASEHGEWDFVDHYFTGSKPNLAHILHLRRPLAPILRGTTSIEDQAERLYAAALDGLGLLIRGGELQLLEGLRESSSAPARNASVPVATPGTSLNSHTTSSDSDPN